MTHYIFNTSIDSLIFLACRTPQQPVSSYQLVTSQIADPSEIIYAKCSKTTVMKPIPMIMHVRINRQTKTPTSSTCDSQRGGGIMWRLLPLLCQFLFCAKRGKLSVLSIRCKSAHSQAIVVGIGTSLFFYIELCTPLLGCLCWIFFLFSRFITRMRAIRLLFCCLQGNTSLVA